MATPTAVVTTASDASCGVRLLMPEFQRPGAPPPSSERDDALQRLPGQVGERRLDAAADLVRVAELELAEDRVDVPFDAALRDREVVGDRAVAPTLGDERQDLSLARRQPLEDGSVFSFLHRQERIDDLRVDDRSPGGDLS